MEAFDSLFRRLRLRPSLLLHGERQQGPLKIALGQQAWICLEVEPPEDWSRSVQDFVSIIEQYAPNITFSYCCITESKIIVRQEAAFVFDDEELVKKGSEFDAPRARRTESGLEFRMGVHLKIGSMHHNKPLKLLMTLSYNVEIFGLSSNALQLEAARRGSDIDNNRRDHLRGYVGMDEEELGVRQLMEFNRFRATKVPPREAELTVSIVKPLRVSTFCIEESPSSTVLTLIMENVYPRRDISVYGVVLHSKDSIKGATLLEAHYTHTQPHTHLSGDGPAGESGSRGHDDISAPSTSDSPHPPMPPSENFAMSVRNDLLHEDDKGGGDLEVVDLEEAAAAAECGGGANAGDGETVPASHTIQGDKDTVNIQQDLEPDHAHDEGEAGFALEAGASRLNSESAYLMQRHGTPLDASALFRFTALDSLSSLQHGETEAPLNIPSGGTHTLRYRVEPRMRDTEETQPYLYSSLLLGDFFSPMSIMWSEVDVSTSGNNDEPPQRQVEPHVAYWSVGKRWANTCAFVGHPYKAGDEESSAADITTPTITPQKRYSATPREDLPGMGTVAGLGTPLRVRNGGHSDTPSGAREGSDGDSGATMVITPSKRVVPPTALADVVSLHSGGQEEGIFTLCVTGPESVTVGVPFALRVEIRNRSDKTCSGLSLTIGGAEGQRGYVVHEAVTTFPQLVWSGQSVSTVLHVYPIRAGALNFTSVQVEDGGDINRSKDGEGGKKAVYDFLQFFSCVAVESTI